MNLKKLNILIVTLCLSLTALAQPEFEDNGDDVPIDGGISLLLAAGLGYGAKKARDAYKASKHEDSE